MRRRESVKIVSIFCTMNVDNSGETSPIRYFSNSALGYADISDAWKDIGYDSKSQTRDPLCSLYNDQFNKVQEALWQSKFPNFEQYAPFEKLDTSRTGNLPAKSVGAPKRKTVKDKDLGSADDEAILERYIEDGTQPTLVPEKQPSASKPKADTSTTDDSGGLAHNEVPFKAQILQVIMFVAAGLLLIALLDLFFRMGYKLGERSLLQ